MRVSRAEIFSWVEQGRIAPAALPAALRLAGITPERAAWRAFLGHLTLWVGTISCAAAAIFFFAYNWAALGRFAKFGLVELLIAGCLALCWRARPQQAAGRAGLTGVVLLTGALLALIGQTYQTGADTWELFAVWALAALPLVLLGSFDVLWVVWIGLVNLGAVLYAGGAGAEPWYDHRHLRYWVAFGVNAVALVCWEGAARTGLAWLRERWPPRLLASACAGLLACLAVMATAGRSDSAGTLVAGVCLAWMATALVVYRAVRLDLFILAVHLLGAIVMATAALVHILFSSGASDFFVSLFVIAALVVAMTTGAVFWLARVARQERA